MRLKVEQGWSTITDTQGFEERNVVLVGKIRKWRLRGKLLGIL